MGKIGHLLLRAQPSGRVDLLDQLSLLLWEGYAYMKGIKRPRRHRTTELVPQTLAVDAYADAEFYRDHLLRQLLPFWEAHSPDRTFGGFVTHLDREGRIYDADAEKSASMQARMTYAFAVGYSLGGSSDQRALADRGMEFLVDHLWDRTFGGWYRSVHRDGRAKHRYKYQVDQAYVIICLIQYHLATSDPSALARAIETFTILDERAWDGVLGGYFELCSTDWVPQSTRKTACVQVDMLAASLALYRVTGTQADLDRAMRVGATISSRMRDRRHRCVLEVFTAEWLYQPGATGDRISIGHNLKAARHFLELYFLTHDLAYLSAAREVAEFCLRCGWDRDYGGFFQHVFRNGTLAQEEKLWWDQCEGFPLLLSLERATTNSAHRSRFLKLADFCFAHFADAEYGEWYRSCLANGSVKDTTKGGDWKAAYHTVEACLYSFHYLKDHAKR